MNFMFLRSFRIVVAVWVGALVTSLLFTSSLHAQTQSPEKVLRYAFNVAETGFDPAQISDLYSRIVTENIFDALYMYDYLARPAKLRPNAAAGMPVVEDDFRTFTVKVRPGIYYADDPAFGGKKRELTAHDFVYSYKRIFDPKTKSQVFPDLEEAKLIGMDQLRQAAEKPGAKFNYDSEVEGLKALDRYTIRFKLAETRPRFIHLLADASVYGAVAREVVEKYGDKIMEHPVGTSAFKLSTWVRSSKMTFVKNPNYREEFYTADPSPDDPVAQALYQKMKGKRLPMIDKVEISIIEESQPRWLSFLQSDHDLMAGLPPAFSFQVIPNNQLAPNLAKRGIVMERVPAPDVTMTYFNMEHPVVGGYTPDKVALRRAIALAYNTDAEIRLARRNQAIAAQGPFQPTTFGYDPKFKSEMSEYSPAKAAALLDMFGYVDKDGDGWRDMPDGSPLVIEYATTPTSADRELNEIWKKSMDAAKIKIKFKTGQWPEHLKQARAGKLMVWGLGYTASLPDGADMLGVAYGPGKGEQNLSRFDNAKFDAIFQKQQMMADGPERIAVMQEAAKVLVAYMPYKFNTHRILTDLSQPWLVGYRRKAQGRDFWKFVDIDTSKLPQ